MAEVPEVGTEAYEAMLPEDKELYAQDPDLFKELWADGDAEPEETPADSTDDDPVSDDNVEPEEEEVEPEAEPEPDADADDEPSPDVDNGKEAAQPAPMTNAQLKELENLRHLYGKQAGELGEARAKAQQYDQIAAALEQNPDIFNALLGNAPVAPQAPTGEAIDPYDPNALRQTIKAELQAEMQQRERVRQAQAQQEKARALQTAVLTTKAQLLASGEATEADLAAAETALLQNIASGKGPEIAHKLANIDKLIAAAEKRGADKVKAQFKTASKRPKTLSTATSTKKDNVGTSDYERMTPEQLSDLASKLPPSSPERAAIERAYDKVIG